MRLTGKVLTQDEKKYVADGAVRYEVENMDLVEDILAILDGYDTKDRALLTKSAMQSNESVAETLQSADMLNALMKTKYIRYVSEMKTLSLEDKFHRIMTFFRMLYPKIEKTLSAEENNSANPLRLLLAAITEILEVLSDEILSNALEGTPDLDEKLLGMAGAAPGAGNGGDDAGQGGENGQGGGVGKGTPFDVNFSGAEKCLENFEKFVTSKTIAEFEAVMLTGDTFRIADEVNASSLERSLSPEDDKRVNMMIDLEDVTNALPSEMAKHDAQSFTVAVAKRDVVIEENLIRQDKDRYKVFIVDMSGSMTSGVSINRYSFASRADLSRAIMLSYLKILKSRNEGFLLRFFAGTPDRLHKAVEDDDFLHIARMISISKYNGGSTDITAAISRAAKDIIEADLTGRSSIVLVSDCEDNLDEEELKKAVHDIDLHTVFCGQNVNTQALEKVSKQFVRVDPNSDNILHKIAEVV